MMKQLLLSLLIICVCSGSTLAQPGVIKYDLVPGFTSSFPQNLTPFGNKLCFYANDGVKGWELWQTTTPGSATMVADLAPGNAVPPMVYTHPACELNGKLYFSVDNGIAGQELFVYDGSNPPTLAQDIETGAGALIPMILLPIMAPYILRQQLLQTVLNYGAIPLLQHS